MPGCLGCCHACGCLLDLGVAITLQGWPRGWAGGRPAWCRGGTWGHVLHRAPPAMGDGPLARGHAP
jgi:hypothetical protein